MRTTLTVIIVAWRLGEELLPGRGRGRSRANGAHARPRPMEPDNSLNVKGSRWRGSVILRDSEPSKCDIDSSQFAGRVGSV